MKHVSILVTTILLSFSCIAQHSILELGLQAGPNLTNMRYESEFVTVYPRIAYTTGLFVQYNINTMFSLRTDPAYERLSTSSGDITFTDANGDILGTGHTYSHYDYFTLPLLLRAGIGNQVKFFAHAGPSFGFLLNQKSIYNTPNSTHTTTATDRFQTVNFGIVTGIGVALPIKKKFALSFELRNNLGLSNINASTKNNSSIKTNTSSLLIGFAYKLGKGGSKETFTPTF